MTKRIIPCLGTLFLFLFSFTSVEALTNSLDCGDFKSILHFIDQQHLRFQFGKLGEKAELLKRAEKEMPKTIESFGYPMMASLYQKKLHSEMQTLDLSHEGKVCVVLKSTFYRAMFLKSFARTLDPYSDFYLTEELDSKSAALDGEFIGVGIATEPVKTYLNVTEVLPGGPSDEKLFVGDRIVSIDHHPVSGLNESEVRKRIRGPLGTKVVFSGIRERAPFEIVITRNRIQQKSVDVRWLDNKTLVIKISKFYRQTAYEVENALKTGWPNAKGLILDLRNNPGGLLAAARDVVDLFISQGVVVYLKSKNTEDQVWALREGSYSRKPIVILINEGTASAAEIVAGALQDYGRAILVGQKTYGKGSVQNIYETPTALGTHYKGGIKLTTLWYYLPSGRSVKSLVPDVKIPPSKAMANFHPPKMPYHGPARINVLPLAQEDLRRKKDWSLSSVKIESIIKGSKNSEDAGRALVLELGRSN